MITAQDFQLAQRILTIEGGNEVEDTHINRMSLSVFSVEKKSAGREKEKHKKQVIGEPVKINRTLDKKKRRQSGERE